VEGRVDRDRVLLRIRDDGVGFDPNVEASDRYGLIGMRERAKEIGADIDILSTDGLGTTVTVTWDVR
jgi:signal transduction histidine kinase